MSFGLIGQIRIWVWGGEGVSTDSIHDLSSWLQLDAHGLRSSYVLTGGVVVVQALEHMPSDIHHVMFGGCKVGLVLLASTRRFKGGGGAWLVAIWFCVFSTLMCCPWVLAWTSLPLGLCHTHELWNQTLGFSPPFNLWATTNFLAHLFFLNLGACVCKLHWLLDWKGHLLWGSFVFEFYEIG